LPCREKKVDGGAIRYSLKMVFRAIGLWTMLRALTSRNNCKKSVPLAWADKRVTCVMSKATFLLFDKDILCCKPLIYKEPCQNNSFLINP
jgi:hypothetical protein